MQLKLGRHTMIVGLALFSIGIILSCNAFAAKPDSKIYATEEDLDTEISERMAADAAEATARGSADTLLQGNINGEATIRLNRDIYLEGLINSVPTPPAGGAFNDMLYWNGTRWGLIPAPEAGDRTLMYCDGVIGWSNSIGDEGPAGGTIFYVDGCGGLEVSHVGIFSEWGCFGTDISGADGAAVGTGPQNTADILAGCGEANIAAEIADDYELNSYTDWYLPSIDELALLFQAGLTGIPPRGSYWSSSEGGPDTAAVYSHLRGVTYPFKNNSLDVVAIRAF